MKNKYVFILTIAIVCSLLLSLAAEGLKERRNKNVEIDIKKNILNAIGVNIDSFSILDIDNYFTDNIDTLVIDIKGNISNLSINDLNVIETKQTGEVLFKELKELIDNKKISNDINREEELDEIKTYINKLYVTHKKTRLRKGSGFSILF